MALGLTAFLRSRCWEQLVFNQSDGPGLVAKVAIALSIPDFQHSFVGISASQWPPKQALRRTDESGEGNLPVNDSLLEISGNAFDRNPSNCSGVHASFQKVMKGISRLNAQSMHASALQWSTPWKQSATYYLLLPKVCLQIHTRATQIPWSNSL